MTISNFTRKDINSEFTQNDYVNELFRGIIHGMKPTSVQITEGQNRYNDEITGYYAATLNSRSSRIFNGLAGIVLSGLAASGVDMPPILEIGGYALLADTVIRESMATALRYYIPRFDPSNDDKKPLPFFRIPLGLGSLELLTYFGRVFEEVRSKP